MANKPSVSYSLRKATIDDKEAITRLIKEGKINPSGLKWERFVVAFLENGEVVGCGQIKPHHDGSFELASIAVTRDWQKLGIAREIIEYLIKHFNESPLYLMCLSIMGTMYEKFGFVSIGGEDLPKYFRRIRKVAGLVESVQSRGETLLVMKRD